MNSGFFVVFEILFVSNMVVVDEVLGVWKVLFVVVDVY